ncbi:MAG: hypothetical protein IPL65_18950 [Lewinellaceae bacterium]|nr:hypothetical protein [Lewinellaceae bacterium]
MTILSIVLSFFFNFTGSTANLTEGNQSPETSFGFQVQDSGSQSVAEFIRPEDGNL